MDSKFGRNDVPQPWIGTEMTPEAFMADAEAQEKTGTRLAIATFVNAYPDPMGDGDEWFIDWIDYSDYRTHQRIGCFDPMEDEPSEELANLLVVERRLDND